MVSVDSTALSGGGGHREDHAEEITYAQRPAATAGLRFLRLYSHLIFDGHLRRHAKESTCTPNLLLCKKQQKQ